MSDSTRKLAAIMFTDIVGYSKLVQMDEEKALDMLDEHNKIVRPVIASHEGDEIKTIGDAFLIQFDSTLNALNCALDIQKKMVAHNAVQAEQDRFKIRIGIHLGDIVFKDDDVFGDGVNIASRIEPMSTPGGICISDQVYMQVKRKTKLTFESLGVPELKNIDDEVEVYKVNLPWEKSEPSTAPSFEKSKKQVQQTQAKSNMPMIAGGVLALLLVAGGGFLFMGGSGDSSGKTAAEQSDEVSIAVLPFVNFSSDKENEYFSDGITEELLNYLAKIRGLRVISRTSVFSFKNRTDLDLTEIGRMLEVNHILEGSVRKSNNKVRITAQLIRVQDDAHLWSETYDRELIDIFAVQDEISQTIVNTLEMDFIGHNGGHAPKKTETTVEAYNLYLKGIHFQSRRTEEGLRKSLTFFKKTVREDPNYELAYVGLANSYCLLADYRYDSYDDNLPLAEHNAQKAMELNPESAEVQTANAFVVMLQGKSPDEIEPYFLRAIELNPNYATAQHWYSDFLRMVKKDYEKALVYGEAAYNLDPLSEIISMNLSNSYRAANQLADAEKLLKKVLELNPNFFQAYNGLAYIYRMQGNWEEAETTAKKGLDLGKDDSNSWLDYAEVLVCRGKEAEALKAFDKALELSPGAPIPLELYAFAQHLFGRNDEAMQTVEKTYELAPELPLALAVEGRTFFKNKKYTKAIHSLKKSRNGFIGLSDLFESYSLYALGVTYAEMGDTKGAESVLKELEGMTGITGVECMKGIINLYLGNTEKGMEFIKNGIINNQPYFYIKVDPLVDPFRNLPQFKEIENLYGIS